MADSEFIVAVSGVFGRVGETARGSRQALAVSLHSVPAALSSLGTLRELLSTKEEVAPEVNGTYIVFMLVPTLFWRWCKCCGLQDQL